MRTATALQFFRLAAQLATYRFNVQMRPNEHVSYIQKLKILMASIILLRKVVFWSSFLFFGNL